MMLCRSRYRPFTVPLPLQTFHYPTNSTITDRYLTVQHRYIAVTDVP